MRDPGSRRNRQTRWSACRAGRPIQTPDDGRFSSTFRRFIAATFFAAVFYVGPIFGPRFAPRHRLPADGAGLFGEAGFVAFERGFHVGKVTYWRGVWGIYCRCAAPALDLRQNILQLNHKKPRITPGLSVVAHRVQLLMCFERNFSIAS